MLRPQLWKVYTTYGGSDRDLWGNGELIMYTGIL
jgi:hypothetical protein